MYNKYYLYFIIIVINFILLVSANTEKDGTKHENKFTTNTVNTTKVKDGLTTESVSDQLNNSTSPAQKYLSTNEKIKETEVFATNDEFDSSTESTTNQTENSDSTTITETLLTTNENSTSIESTLSTAKLDSTTFTTMTTIPNKNDNRDNSTSTESISSTAELNSTTFGTISTTNAEEISSSNLSETTDTTTIISTTIIKENPSDLTNVSDAIDSTTNTNDYSSDLPDFFQNYHYLTSIIKTDYISENESTSNTEEISSSNLSETTETMTVISTTITYENSSDLTELSETIDSTTNTNEYSLDLANFSQNYRYLTSITTDNFSENESTTIDSTTESDSTSTTIKTTTENPCDDEFEVTHLKIFPNIFNLTVKWNAPEVNADCSFSYLIRWKAELDDKENNGTSTETSFFIKDLKACQKYKIYVSVVYNNKIKIPLNAISTTKEAILSVVDLKYNENENNNILISWNLPTNVETCLIYYHIQIFQDNTSIIEFQQQTNELNISNINSCIKNTYVVVAHSQKFSSKPKTITFFSPKKNDAPKSRNFEVSDDFVLTEWDFGEFVCRPQQFLVNCTMENKNFTVLGSIEKDVLIAQINDILPYKNYVCCGFIRNEVEESDCSENIKFLTRPKPPSEPTNLQIKELDDSKVLNIKWSPPKEWNGKEVFYEISITFVKLNYNLTQNCNESKSETLKVNVTSETIEYNSSKVVPASQYKIEIKAISSGGAGNSIEESVDTNEDVPEKPLITSIDVFRSDENEYNATANLTWVAPCDLNGILIGFHIVLIGSRGIEIYKEEFDVEPTGESNYIFLITNLRPEYNYAVMIQSQINFFASDFDQGHFETPAGIPEKPESAKLKSPNSSATSEPWRTALLYIRDDLFTSEMGNILYYAVIISLEFCTEQPKYQFYDKTNWPPVVSDNISCRNELRAYQATDNCWNPFGIRKGYREVPFILGNNDHCEKFDCNRPLTPDTKYFVKIRGFTKDGFSDSELMSFFTEKEPNDVPVGLIVGLIVGILAIAFLIAAVLFFAKGKINLKNWPRSMESSSQLSPAPLPVSVRKFRSHYIKMIENPGKIKNEFQLLSTISADVTLSTKTAQLPINKKKNRYINILPYDDTRVILEDNSTNSSDYINASFIKGYSGSIEYIATQGPTEATSPVFWQMILEQNIKLIVMLTQFVEAGKDKCYKYYPDLKEEYDLQNDIKVQCVEEELLHTFNRRVFKVIKDEVEKKVTHIQFNLWPDFGVPDELRQMIDFCEIIKDIKMKKPSVIVMHCSAGVGRTGTLIAVDILLQTIRDKRKVDIFGTVLNLRKQRMNMVQSEKQYEFLYRCVDYVIAQAKYSGPKLRLRQISESNML